MAPQIPVWNGPSLGVSYQDEGSIVGGKWQPGTSYTGLVATRCKSPTNLGTGNVSDMSRSIHVARTNITQIGVAIANWYVGAAGELGAGGTVNVTAQIEYPLGVAVKRWTFGGQNQGSALDYQTLASDLMTIAIPNGALFGARIWRNFPSGGAIVFNGLAGIDTADGCSYNYGASAVPDLTGVPGTFAGGDGNSYHAPIALFGPTNVPSYALSGDSRGEGASDTGSGNLYVGLLERPVGPLRAYVNLCKYGEIAGQAATGSFRQRAAIISAYCTHILCNYGVNDLFNGSTADQTLKYIDQIRAQFPNQFFHMLTIPGETTSTDSWATTGNQTTANAGDEAQRKILNNYLRSPLALSRLDAVFDICPTLETAQNSGIWKAPGFTGDGVHPSTAAYALVASSGAIVVA